MKPFLPIAVTTGSLYPLPTLESIRQIRELGIQDIELTLQSNEFHLTFERKFSIPILTELSALVQSGKLRVRSVHAPTIRADRSYNLWARTKHLEHAIEVCHLLGGQVVVIHPEHLFQIYEDALDYLQEDSKLQPSALLPEINRALELAQSSGVMLALENIQDWHDEIFFNAPQNMLRFLQDMDHPSVGCTLDLMHAQYPGFVDGFIDCLSDHIVNIHAADMLPPWKRVAIGKGVIDWKNLVPKLQALPNLRQLTIELANPQINDVIESVHILSNLIK